MTPFRVGFGYDVHQLVEGRPLILGGIEIKYSHGLLGHSDADVLLHVICDALLGAANLRDIGFNFPDTAKEYEGIDSKRLLGRSVQLVKEKGYEVGNIDCTICAEAPKLNPHMEAMRRVIAGLLEVDADQVSIKATTTERLGFVGRKEGMEAHCVALIVAQS